MGEVVCAGNTAQTCDGNCGWSDSDCGRDGLVCVDGVGCLTCEPGLHACMGEDLYGCNDRGDGWQFEQTCDGLQGIECDADIGACVGACADLGPGYIGCDYYPTVTANGLESSAGAHFGVAVSNTSLANADITVTKGDEEILVTTVAAMSVEIIELPWVFVLKHETLPFNPVSVLVPDGAYRLRSTQPVTVYQYNPLEYLADDFTYSNDASLLLPVNTWTGDYFVAARNTASYVGLPTPGFYAVTASEDGTTVMVQPSATGDADIAPGGGIQADGSGMAALDQGDVLEVFSAGGYEVDVTGTRITSDNPIQVIAGHWAITIPDGVFAADHLEESMLPFETLAKDYLVTTPLVKPPAQNPFPKPRFVRVIATTDDTSLTYDPPNMGPAMLAGQGDFFEIGPTDEDFRIEADFKVVVVEYMQGEGAGGQTGDPAMVLSVPTEQFRNEYMFHASTNYESNFVNVSAPAGATITLDGAVVTGFVPIGASGFEVARVELSNAGDGNHSIVGDELFGITVYGYGQYTSYWYPGGLDLHLIPQ